jgi:aspartate aminotransferase
VSTGAKQSLANAVLCLINPGDEAIIPTPYWVTYAALVTLSEGKPVFVPCGIETDFKICPDTLEAAITDKTRLFMFSSPCNPTGAVYLKEELAALAAVFQQHPHVYVMSDEIYEHINFIGQHESIAQFDFLKERVILVNGLSKGYAMTGWRLGYIAATPAIAKAADKLQGQFTSATCSIAQRAAIAALNGDLRPTHDMVAAFKERREKVLELMNHIPGIACTVPPGAFYVFPNVQAYFGKKTPAGNLISNADDLCMYLLNDAHVSTVSGKAFGEPNSIRLSFANSIQNIEKGIIK